MIGEARRFGSYVVVGTFSLACEYGSFLVLYYAVGAPLVLANVLAFGVGFTVNFTLNRAVTFALAGRPGWRRQLVLYLLLALFNVGVTTVALVALKHHGVAPAAGKPFLIAVVAIWNYVLLRNVIFRHRSSMRPLGQPKVELLWWEGCPSTEEALALLREEVAGMGLDPQRVEMREVGTDDAARREDFVGSPTIRVDGRDVQPPKDEPIGLNCRVYRLRDGRVSPLPDREDVRAALLKAMKGGE